MENETLDSIAITSAPTRNLEGAGGILAMGIISIPFCLGFFGIILAVFTLIKSGQAMAEFKKNPLLYTESSLKKVKAGRICAIVSICLLGAAILIIMAGGLG